MKLKQYPFNTSPTITVVRDTDGQFYLQDGTGKRKSLDRDEARELIYLHKPNDKKNESQYTNIPIGEQWFGHKEFFEHGKAFVRIAHNELSRDWKETYGLAFPETHRSTAYNLLHGIELGLKAFILFMNERLLPNDLKENYGHNLNKLLMDASENGLEIERCVVIPYDDQSRDEEEVSGSMPKSNWLEEVFGKASSEDERRLDFAIGINFTRYAMKGTEFPISIYEEQEYYYLASIAGMAYTLFNEIRNTDGFFDHKQRDRHDEFEIWLQELHTQRKNHILSDEETAEKLAELDKLIDSCDDLPSPDKEPDWEEQLEIIRQPNGRRTTST